jgi:hypothetical protein
MSDAGLRLAVAMPVYPLHSLVALRLLAAETPPLRPQCRGRARATTRTDWRPGSEIT